MEGGGNRLGGCYEINGERAMAFVGRFLKIREIKGAKVPGHLVGGK